MNIAPTIKRFFAQIIDSIIYNYIFIIMIIITDDEISSLIWTTAVQIIINIPMWRSSTTIGKKIAGIKVVNKKTQIEVGYIKMFIREIIGKYISFIILYSGFIMIFFDKNKQGLHDKLIGSIVVEP